MKSSTIEQLTELARNRPHLAICIQDYKGNEYQIQGWIRVLDSDLLGEYLVYYKDSVTGKVYARKSEDFGDFDEVVT